MASPADRSSRVSTTAIEAVGDDGEIVGAEVVAGQCRGRLGGERGGERWLGSEALEHFVEVGQDRDPFGWATAPQRNTSRSSQSSVMATDWRLLARRRARPARNARASRRRGGAANSTVRGETNSCSAIALLDWPAAAMAATSRSRGVSLAVAPARASAGVLACSQRAAKLFEWSAERSAWRARWARRCAAEAAAADSAA